MQLGNPWPAKAWAVARPGALATALTKALALAMAGRDGLNDYVLLAGWLAGWLAGLLACWLAGLLGCWLAGWLADMHKPHMHKPHMHTFSAVAGFHFQCDKQRGSTVFQSIYMP